MKNEKSKFLETEDFVSESQNQNHTKYTSQTENDFLSRHNVKNILISESDRGMRDFVVKQVKI